MRCNQAMAELLRATPEEVVGQPFHALAEAGARTAVRGTEPRAGRRIVTELPIGEQWFRATSDPILDDQGELTGAVLMLADITDRKQSEEALLDSEERFRTISGLVPLVAYQIYPDGRVVRQTTGAFQRIGYAPEELDELGWQSASASGGRGAVQGADVR